MSNILIAVPSKREKLPLSVTHPALAKEANGWDPSTVTRGARTKLSWKCELGHIWDAQPNDRTSAKSGCPVCANRKLLSGFNDLGTTHPNLAKQAHGWNPSEVMAGSSKSLEWKCEKGHIWQSIPVSRVRQETGCLVCLGKQVHKGFNDLATTHPEIAVQANGWDPTLVIAGSNKKFPWKCELGHIWDAQPNNLTSAKSGCPVCANSRVEIGYNDLATTHPDIAAQVFEWDPRTVVAGSHKSKLWKCKFGHIWKSQVISRTSQKTGCLVCTNKQVQIGFNDLATTHPNIAEEASGWDPTNVIAGSERRLAWKCKLGHSYKSTVKSRAISGTSCPICSGNQVLQGFNDLTTTHPDLAFQAVGWNTDDYISGSHSRKLWRCDLGHEWFAQIKSRALTGNNCPICGNFQVLPGFNDLATTHPELSQQAFNWDPTTVVSGSSQKRKWICPIMHTWTASINSRTNQSNGGGSGCPSCAVTGFDPNKDGYFYFLEHLNWEMYQVGITNHPGDRLKNHNKLGWDALELRGPMDGHLTQQWETAILRMLKAKGADLSNEKIAGKFDGYSEAWSKSTFEVSSIKELMRMTEEFEEKKAL